MNCQEIVRILNDRLDRRLFSSELQQVEAHLAVCAECARDWSVQERLDAALIPEMPASLLHWRPDASRRETPIAPAARRRRSSFIAPILLLAGAAAATLAVYGTRERADEVPVFFGDASGVAAQEPVDAPEELFSGNDAIVVDSGTPETSGDAPRHKLLVFPPAHQGEYDAAAVQAAEEIRRGILRFFGSRPEIQVVEISTTELADAQIAVLGALPEPVPPNRISEVPYAITTYLGAEHSVRVLTRTTQGSRLLLINVQYHGPTTSGSHGQSGPISESDAAEIARRTYAGLFPDAGLPLLESVASDSSYSDAERLSALQDLVRRWRSRAELSAAVAARNGVSTAAPELPVSPIHAAIELGRSGTSAETRQTALTLLAQTRHPLAAQALVDALVGDADPGVRAAVADELLDYQDDPVVLASLQAAATRDTSAVVRMRARWSSLTYAERADFVAASLLDTTLAPEQRIAPLMHARFPPRGVASRISADAEIPPVTGEALDAVAAIAASSNDTAVRGAALTELGAARDPRFLALLQAEPDARTRAGVPTSLLKWRETPGFMDFIERQLDEANADQATRTLFARLFNPPGLGPQPAQRPSGPAQ